MQTVGERIRILRKELKLNQSYFGKKIGISYGHISNIENNKDMPSPAIIKLIAINYGTTEEWLEYGVGEMFPSVPIDNPKVNAVFTDMDNSLCEVSSLEESQLKVEILQYIVLLFQREDSQNETIYQEKLEVLCKILKGIYTCENHLRVLQNRSYTLTDEDVINKLLDDAFGDFSTFLYDFVRLYNDELEI